MEIRARLKAESGGIIEVCDDSEVYCEVHGVRTTWGKLDPIQQLAVEEGLDTLSELECLLTPQPEGLEW